jgi:hypothetical protein
MDKTRLHHRARHLVYYAVKRGTILKLECSGQEPHIGRIEAHHYMGYEEEHALDVHWLCKKHHLEAHGRKDWSHLSIKS